MSLDLSKLQDAITRVASLAADRDAAKAAQAVAEASVASAQADIDALTAQLVAAVNSPAEAVGLIAVAAALVAPAPVVDASVTPAVAPTLPLGPVVPVATFLPGDPRAPKV
jgi:hypothetical protein